MYKEDLALNNLQWLICHKTKANQVCVFSYAFCLSSCNSVSFYIYLIYILYFGLVWEGISEFSTCVSLKKNEIAQLDFELAYYSPAR